MDIFYTCMCDHQHMHFGFEVFTRKPRNHGHVIHNCKRRLGTRVIDRALALAFLIAAADLSCRGSHTDCSGSLQARRGGLWASDLAMESKSKIKMQGRPNLRLALTLRGGWSSSVHETQPSGTRMFEVGGSGQGGFGADKEKWFLSDYFQTTSSWGGDVPCNDTATSPVEHINLHNLDENGPMFHPSASESACSQPTLSHTGNKRRRHVPTAGPGAPSQDQNDDTSNWVECDNDADALAQVS